MLSRDIPASDVPEDVEIIWMDAHETREIAGVVVKTLRSTDEGVAFLLETEGTLLYHAGDLNNWYWEGESDAYNREMAEAYRSELALLPAHLDIAFVPVDPRLGKAYSLGARELLTVSVKMLVPMHFGATTASVSGCRASWGPVIPRSSALRRARIPGGLPDGSFFPQQPSSSPRTRRWDRLHHRS